MVNGVRRRDGTAGRTERLVSTVAALFGSATGKTASGKEAAPMKGQGSEPVELRPGVAVREQARIAEIEQWAWRRVRAMRAFYTHLTLYVGVNFILFLVDTTTPGPAWFYIPLLSWGLIVVMHGLHAYDMLPWTTGDWEKRKVRELIISRLRADKGLDHH